YSRFFGCFFDGGTLLRQANESARQKDAVRKMGAERWTHGTFLHQANEGNEELRQCTVWPGGRREIFRPFHRDCTWLHIRPNSSFPWLPSVHCSRLAPGRIIRTRPSVSFNSWKLMINPRGISRSFM